MSQQDFSQLIGKSVSTVQSLETGRLKMSHETATIIARATGVNFRWLVIGKPETQVLGENGKPYTLETFERTQIKRIEEERTGKPSPGSASELARKCKSTKDLFEEFVEHLPDHPDADLWLYRMDAAITKVAGKFNEELMKRQQKD